MDNNTNIKKYLLKNIIYFDKFCEENQLTYYLIGGTLLGAVRHKGFIPWDDDLDVAMPRSDYNKLLQLFKCVDSGDYKLECYQNNKDYIYPFAKLCSQNFIAEESFHTPFKAGVWIDIFPLDYTFENIVMQKLQFQSIKILRNILILKYGAFKSNKYSRFFTIIIKLFSAICKVIPRRVLNYLFNFFQIIIPNFFSNKQLLANFNGAWGIKEVAPIKIFNERKKYEFENLHFYSIKDFDYWLKKVYGDYMILPPKQEQVVEHIGKIITLGD